MENAKFFYGIHPRYPTNLMYNFLTVYIFLTGWKTKIITDGDMQILSSMVTTFQTRFFETTHATEFVQNMIRDTGGLNQDEIQNTNDPNLKDYFMYFNQTLNAVHQYNPNVMLRIGDQIFKHFIPVSFKDTYKAFHVFTHFSSFTSTSLQFHFYLYANMMDPRIPKNKIEDEFSFAINLSPRPHLKIEQLISNNTGGAQRMVRESISIFNKFPELNYIETDAVNPITYHIVVKQGFKPVCVVDKNYKCVSRQINKKYTINTQIYTEYTDIVKQPNVKLNKEQHEKIKELYKDLKQEKDPNHEKGVKLRLFKHVEDVSSGGKLVPAKSLKYRKGIPSTPKTANNKITTDKKPPTGKVHTGPRGGKYVIRNGKKVYL